MEDLKTWIIKILLPSIVAIGIKLAIQSKRGTVTWFNVVISFITGVGSAYLFSGLIMTSFAPEYVPLAIGAVSISGEKIGYWAIYRFRIESLLEGVLERMKGKK